MNGKTEPVEDEALSAALAKKGKAIYVKTIVLALIGTAVVYFI